ncbi:MAG: UvrD-helicase domain-containing protein [Nitrospirae bacterium]|nr:UvrD-helicase domain-containing protein [Nitrospirota bacterium]
MIDPIADAPERERAATTFDRNVVVTAGAGTGKTTLLINRLIHLLMKEPRPLKVTEIIALTFTNKAADEIRTRLRSRLRGLLEAASEESREEARELMERYRLEKDQIDARVREALAGMEKGEIGTIHSFASRLLRLYPVEAGVDPQFQEDEGIRFERHFKEKWEAWLDREIGVRSLRKEAWKTILRRVSLDQITELVRLLCSEIIPLNQLEELSVESAISLLLRNWLFGLERAASKLSARFPGERNIEKMIRASQKIFREILADPVLKKEVLKEEIDLLLSGKPPGAVKGWDESEVEEAGELIRAAKGLVRADSGLIGSLIGLVLPFVKTCRESFLRGGYISFDGLLVRARNLVRDHRPVREELKRSFQAILIDEFQDTDPLQYEILLYLAEAPGEGAGNWREVRLEPGKLFVVGDPKQSIYAFRRADIEAYLDVVKGIIESQNGIHCPLRVNFRSHSGILDVVNGVFDPLMIFREGVQPSYVPIHTPSEKPSDPAYPFRRVEVRKIIPSGEKFDAQTARRFEAESISEWLSKEVLGKALIPGKGGEPAAVEPGDVAVLMRSLSEVREILEAFRKRNIRYVVEGEKDFYSTQEVVQAIDLLRALIDPHDTLALAGVLRSPVGGLSDLELYKLKKENLLDYRLMALPDAKFDKERLGPARELYTLLYRLHREIPTLQVGEAVGRVLDEIPVRIIAARGYKGEQAIANLEKIRRLAESMGEEGGGTLKETVSMLEQGFLEKRSEPENPLVEEHVNAVRIMSIHKAKGLEFPVVILPGCQSGVKGSEGKGVEADFDWSANLTGIKIGDISNPASVFLSEKKRVREKEEQKRVLYVAMTRPREHLMISFASTGKRQGGSFLTMFEASAGELEKEAESRALPVGRGEVRLTLVRESSLGHPIGPAGKKSRERIEEDPEWETYLKRWDDRQAFYNRAAGRPLFLTPTLLQKREAEKKEPPDRRGKTEGSGSPGPLIGELVHRFLQQWDFKKPIEGYRADLTPLLSKWLKTGSAIDPHAVYQEIIGILDLFFASEPYQEISSSVILGREVPLLMAWGDQIMEGVIDIIYEREGNLYAADYKTDRVKKEDVARTVEKYHHQAEVYSQAVSRTLQREVTAFKFIFLRLGESFPVKPSLPLKQER